MACNTVTKGCDAASIVDGAMQQWGCCLVEVQDMRLALRVVQSFSPVQVSPTRSTVIGCEVGDEIAASYRHIVKIGCTWATTNAGKGQVFFLELMGKTRCTLMCEHCDLGCMQLSVLQAASKLHCMGSARPDKTHSGWQFGSECCVWPPRIQGGRPIADGCIAGNNRKQTQRHDMCACGARHT